PPPRTEPATVRPAPPPAQPAPPVAETTEPAPIDEPAAEPSEQTIRIVDIQTNDFGTTRFTTSSGDVWIQQGGAAGRYPQVPFDATLIPAMRDTFFLVSPRGGPRVRVNAAR
ncbi:MAG: hypothetical protein R3305_07980, partial [Gammaproteobacteria bacterium]|nr:hypothetical protein [Gammaproteobacteria bacterium]